VGTALLIAPDQPSRPDTAEYRPETNAITALRITALRITVLRIILLGKTAFIVPSLTVPVLMPAQTRALTFA